MTQNDRWHLQYNQVVQFIETNHRNPSRHRLEDHRMLNWLKAQRKAYNKGKLPADRLKLFEHLLALIDKHRRLNQFT